MIEGMRSGECLSRSIIQREVVFAINGLTTRNIDRSGTIVTTEAQVADKVSHFGFQLRIDVQCAIQNGERNTREVGTIVTEVAGL